MKIDLFKDKLGDWLPFWEPFILSKKMDNIYKQLKEKSLKNKMYPKNIDTYKAFKLCPPENLKVIIIGGDPYAKNFKNGLPHADGLLFGHEYSDGAYHSTLKNFLDGISFEYRLVLTMEYKIKENLDLSYLAEQGVLLLNSALTIDDTKESHANIWKPFYEYFFQKIQRKYSQIPILYIGDTAKDLSEIITSAYQKKFFVKESKEIIEGEKWKTNDSFMRINNIVRTNSNCAIKWRKQDWDEIQKELNSSDEFIKKLANLKDGIEGLPF